MNQTTNKNNKKNLRPVPQAEMRQNVLKSGLCNELIAGVLTDNGEIPDISGRTAGGVQNVAATQSMEATPPMASGESQPQIQQEVRPSDEEIKLYIKKPKGKLQSGRNDNRKPSC